MYYSGFFKLADLVDGGTSEVASAPTPQGIPVVDKLVTPASLSNTAIDMGHKAVNFAEQHPGFIGDVAHVATDSGLLNRLINNYPARKIRSGISTAVNSRPAQYIANNPTVRKATSFFAPRIKQVAEGAPYAAPFISAASGANRYRKDDMPGAALDGLSAISSGLALKGVKPRITIPLAIGADVTNMARDYRSAGYPGLRQLGQAASKGIQAVSDYTTSGNKSYQTAPNQVTKPATAIPGFTHPKVNNPTEQPNVKAAFIRGIQKRAEQLGLEKEAFIAPLLAGALDIAGSLGGAHLLTKGLGRLAAMKNMGALGKGAKKFYNWTQSPGTTMGPLVGNMAMMTASDMATRPVLSPIKRMLGLEQPEAPQYQ